MSELKELKEFWNTKYPNIIVDLWSNHDNDRFFGKMISMTESIDLQASTIGEIIAQGEAFLRRTKQ
jgi:hypothetical protein